jgi:hypothetical protein
MRKLLLLGVVALVLFGISAGVSYYLKDPKEAKKDGPDQAMVPPEKQVPSSASTVIPKTAPGDTRMAPAVNVHTDPKLDRALPDILNLNDQLKLLKEKETRLSKREKDLLNVQAEIRKDIAKLEKLKAEVLELTKKLDETTVELELRAADLKAQTKKNEELYRAIQSKLKEVDASEQQRLKAAGQILEKSEPATAAQTIQAMADDGQMENAAKVLSVMDAKKVAKILEEVPVPVRAQLLAQIQTLTRAKTPSKK